MRGFSNRDFAESRPQELIEPELSIARRFAPVRRSHVTIVSSQETISGELGKEQPIAMSWDLAKRSFAQGFRCLWNIKRVLLKRAQLRGKLAYHRVMQARVLPWALAGSGWGMSIGLMVIVVVVR